MDGIELSDLNRNKEEEEQEKEEETDLGESSKENDFLGRLDWLISQRERSKSVEKLFGNEEDFYVARSIAFLFDDVLLLEPDCTNVDFIRWLREEKGFKIKKTIRMDGLLVDYEFSYNSSESDDGGNVWNITGSFKTTNGVSKNSEQFSTARTDVSQYYDDWRKIKLDRVLNRSGIATGLGLSVIVLRTGLALGLRRSGNDIINVGVKPKPVKPGEKTKRGAMQRNRRHCQKNHWKRAYVHW